MKPYFKKGQRKKYDKASRSANYNLRLLLPEEIARWAERCEQLTAGTNPAPVYQSPDTDHDMDRGAPRAAQQKVKTW